VYRLGLRYKSIGKWQVKAFTVRKMEASYDYTDALLFGSCSELSTYLDCKLLIPAKAKHNQH